MRYKDLLAQLQRLTPEQLEQNITVYNAASDEFYGAGSLCISRECHDAVDLGTLYMQFDGEIPCE